MAALALAVPLFFYITPTLDDNDLLFYKIILQEFSHQFWAGDLSPHWLYRANDGSGSPVFLFYGPVSFYLGSLFEFLADFDRYASIRFVLSIIAARLLAGWLCYLWLKHHTQPGRALLITVLYLTIPYTIHILYVQTALASQWTMAVIFAMFLALDAVIAQRNYALAILSVLTALLLMTHLPTALTFLGVPYLYLYFLSREGERTRNFLKLVLANALGSGLSALYLLPLCLNKNTVNSTFFTQDRYDFSHNFLTNLNEVFCIPYFIIALAALVIFLRRRPGETKTVAAAPNLMENFLNGKFGYFLFAQLLFMSFLLLPVSLPVWQLVKPLQYIQFPFRFLNVMLLPFACCATFLILTTRYAPFVWMVWGLGLLLHGEMIYSYAPHDPNGPLLTIAQEKLINHPEYLTKWNIDPDLFVKFARHDFQRKPQAELLSGTGTLEMQDAGFKKIRVAADIKTHALMQLKWFYFPGAQVLDVEKGIPLKLDASVPQGFIDVPLFPGHYTLEASFPAFPGEREGREISLLFLGILLAIALKDVRRKPWQPA